jgi:uncharacterized protein (TIGR02421 family)
MEKIPVTLFKHVEKQLSNGKSVRRKLPGGGIIHIDRPLPFLFVYKYDAYFLDDATSSFIESQASYLKINNCDPEDIATLIDQVSHILSDQFGAFLIINLWSIECKNEEEAACGPNFRILCAKSTMPSTAGVLKKALENVRIIKKPAQVLYEQEDFTASRDVNFFPSKESLSKHGVLLLGLEIQAFYLNPDNKKPYPLMVRHIRAKLSAVFQKTIFDFVKVQTNKKVSHYQALGRQAVSRSIWNIDKKLVEISNAFQFLMLVTPVNGDDAWLEFEAMNFEKVPVFHYRLLPVDPDLIKRKLYNLPIDKVDDPTLAYLLRDKRQETDKMLTMLSHRNTTDFLYGSMQIFGGVDDELLQTAKSMLRNIPATARKTKEFVSPKEFADIAWQEIGYLKSQWEGVETTVEIRPDVMGLMVSDGRLYIGRDYSVPRHRVEALIQHEVGTHVLTYFNGKAQPLQQLSAGVPGYEELQEGLAVLSEYLVGGLDNTRLRILAARIIAVHALIDGATFIETFRLLHHGYNFEPKEAYELTMRVFRGGGLTKDAVYLKGLLSLLNYLSEGHDLEPLLIGKIREDYLSIVQELTYRQVLRSAPIRPRYLNDPVALERLKSLKQPGTNIFNLIASQDLQVH